MEEEVYSRIRIKAAGTYKVRYYDGDLGKEILTERDFLEDEEIIVVGVLKASGGISTFRVAYYERGAEARPFEKLSIPGGNYKSLGHLKQSR